MKNHSDDVYSTSPPATIEGPLFAPPESGPFDNSPCPLTSEEEQGVAHLIWDHKGRHNPIALATISQITGLVDRTIKGVVEKLRFNHHMPIGARREDPSGYFWIMDAEDREMACTPYRRQVITMFQTLRVLDSPHALRELLGQLRLEVE